VTEPTHGEILRAIGVLEGQLKQLLDAAISDKTERTRMGQVVILAVVAAMLSPIIWSEIKSAFSYRQSMPQQIQRP